jgi:hypothetical protein
MRPSRMVVGSALTAALALVALPGLAGSRAPSPIEPVPLQALQPLTVSANTARSALAIGSLDPAFVSAGPIEPGTRLIELGEAPERRPGGRPRVGQPVPAPGSQRAPEKDVLRGEATFYDHGTTAMRLPRGTVVIICGAGGCIERVVTDYGPVKPSRIVDLYRPDFFAICGCPWYAGTTEVTVYVY